MSPSPGCAKRSSAAATDSGIAPRCTGMCAACATICPAGSKTAHEKSRRSLMLGEKAVRPSARAHLLGHRGQQALHDFEQDRIVVRSWTGLHACA